MATYVVDASVAVKWALNEPDSDQARRLTAHSLIAPPLLAIECANVVGRLCQTGALTAAEAEAALAIILSPKLIWRSPDIADVLRLAIAIGCPAYDCAYLVLAEAAGVPLVTADQRLLAKAAGVERLKGRVVALGEVAEH